MPTPHRDRNGLTFPTSSAEQIVAGTIPYAGCVTGGFPKRKSVSPTHIRCHAVASIGLDHEENAKTGKSQAFRRAIRKELNRAPESKLSRLFGPISTRGDLFVISYRESVSSFRCTATKAGHR